MTPRPEITAELRNLVRVLDLQADMVRRVEEARSMFDTHDSVAGRHHLAALEFELAQAVWDVACARYAVAQLETEDELIPGAHLEPDLVLEPDE